VHDTGRMRISPGGDALTGLSTPFTKFAWFLILQQRCGISEGGQLASSLIKAVSLKRRQEHGMVDLVANLEKQQQTIIVEAPEHGCQPEEDVENRVTQAASSTTTTIAEIMAEDLPYSRNNCDRGCGDTDEHSCRYCGITFCAECQRQGFRYLFDCMCGERLVAGPAAHSVSLLVRNTYTHSGRQPAGLVGVAGSP
jgi:hypothetical protein